MNATGRKTTMMVKVVAMTASPISAVASRAAAPGGTVITSAVIASRTDAARRSIWGRYQFARKFEKNAHAGGLGQLGSPLVVVAP